MTDHSDIPFRRPKRRLHTPELRRRTTLFAIVVNINRGQWGLEITLDFRRLQAIHAEDTHRLLLEANASFSVSDRGCEGRLDESVLVLSSSLARTAIVVPQSHPLHHQVIHSIPCRSPLAYELIQHLNGQLQLMRLA